MLGRILMTLSLKSPDRNYRTLYGMWKTLPLVVTLIGITSPGTAQTSTNLCALMPDAEVSAVVGTPVKLSAKPMETNPVGGGGTLHSQECLYEAPGGIGTGTTSVRIGIDEADSPMVAAKWFKAMSELPSGAGKAEPLSGLGDEAIAYPQAGAVHLRKKNMLVNILVSRRDLDLQKELDLSKQLAQKAVARIK